MRVLSLFTGVGGFDIGLENAGMTTVFQCEIDKHCQSVLRHRWPDVPKWDDVTTLTGRHIIDTVGQVDVVAWGSPCQDLSVAGRRAGLAGGRSGLFHQGIRIIKELREITDGKSPTWSVWENVYGALSSNGGADFGEVLWEMDEAGACFSEWAVLDAQHFGVPQRRRRVFVASCFDSGTAERCPSPLLPVAESGAGDSAKSRKKREEPAGEIAPCLRSGGDGGVPSSRGEHLIVEGDPIVFAPGAISRLSGSRFSQDVVHTLCAEMGDNRPMVAQEPLQVDGSPIAATLRGFGHGWQGQHNTTNAVAQEPMAYDEFNDSLNYTHHSIRAGTRQSTGVVDSNMIVRRLTPVECERLMGWPDDHTAVGVDGPVKDTNRYKMCGNGVASPVAAWIGKHLMRTRPNPEHQSFMDHYLDQLEWERSNPDTPMLNG